MKKTSIEVKGAIESREDLEAAMGEYARAALALEGAKVEMEARLQEAREEFEARLPVLKTAAEAAFKPLELWARRHPEQFAQRRSLELVHGRIGFRTGQPRVSLRRGTDEEALCRAMRLGGAAEFVRERLEIDREAAIRAFAAADADAAARQRVLSNWGVRVSQTERFFAEPREEAVDE